MNPQFRYRAPVFRDREHAKTGSGDRFDIRDFHDVVLKNGAVPLSILEELVDDYIAKKKAS